MATYRFFAMQKYFRQAVAFFALISIVTPTPSPAQYVAECQQCTPECIVVTPEDKTRGQVAAVVTGVSLAALAGIIACSACGCSGRNHSSSGYSYYTPYSYWYSGDSDDSSHKSYSHKSYSHSYDSWQSVSGYSAFSENNVSSWSDYGSGYSSVNGSGFNGHINADPIGGGEFPVHHHHHSSKHKSHYHRVKTLCHEESCQLSATFSTLPVRSCATKGAITPFVQLPDGSTETLGSIPLSETGTACISCGPFSQKGSYAFGLYVNGTAPTNGKICRVEIKESGAVVQSGEFSAHSDRLIHYTVN